MRVSQASKPETIVAVDDAERKALGSLTSSVVEDFYPQPCSLGLDRRDSELCVRAVRRGRRGGMRDRTPSTCRGLIFPAPCLRG